MNAEVLPITTRAFGEEERLSVSAEALTLDRVVELFTSTEN
jgi:hypothetical protein